MSVIAFELERLDVAAEAELGQKTALAAIRTERHGTVLEHRMLEDLQRCLGACNEAVDVALQLTPGALVRALQLGGADQGRDFTFELALVVELDPATGLECTISQLDREPT